MVATAWNDTTATAPTNHGPHANVLGRTMTLKKDELPAADPRVQNAALEGPADRARATQGPGREADRA